jgi:hypothetical protein
MRTMPSRGIRPGLPGKCRVLLGAIGGAPPGLMGRPWGQAGTPGILALRTPH